MTDRLIVKGVPSVDGEYEFSLIGLLTLGDADALTNREAHLIKTMTGIRLGELEDALTAGDNDIMVALAAVVLGRHGRQFNTDSLWDAPAGSGISFELADDEEAVMDGPPVGTGDEPAPNETEKSSGDDSTSDSESPENGQSRTGHPESARSAISDLVILGN